MEWNGKARFIKPEHIKKSSLFKIFYLEVMIMGGLLLVCIIIGLYYLSGK